MNICGICKNNPSTIHSFIGEICNECDERTTKMAEEKLKTWNLPRFDKTCDIEHECQLGNPDDVLIRYEDNRI